MKDEVKTSVCIQELYDLYHLDVYRFLRTFTGNKNDAEDLTQDTFIQLLKSKDSFANLNNPKTWILTIAKHKAIDHYRKQKCLVFIKDKILNQIPGINLDPSYITNGIETNDELMKCIDSLKANFRLVIILRGINELTIAETASVLNWSESKVKTSYHRALKQLRSKLTSCSKGGIILEKIR